MVDSIHHKHKVVLRLLFFLLLFYTLPVSSSAEEFPFKVGEKLIYKAEFLFLDAGRVEMEVSEIETSPGRNLMHFSLRSVTTHFVAKLFTMDDWFHTYWDAERRLPEKLIIKIRESTTKKDKTVDFYHELKKAVIVKNNREPEEKELHPKAQNFISMIYFLRTYPLKVKDKYSVPVFEDNKNYDAVLKVLSKERIYLMGGKVDTIKVLAKLKFDGAFWGSSRVILWVTDDEYKIPVKMRINMFIGSITATLIDTHNAELNIIDKKK